MNTAAAAPSAAENADRAFPSIEDRLATLSVLQELTAAAMALFDPSCPLDDFLERLATRLLGSAALCVRVDAPGHAPSIAGAAGLPRRALAADLSALAGLGAGEAAWDRAALPIPEVSGPRTTRWAFALGRGGGAPEAAAPAWLLLLFFDGPPRVPPRYRGVVEQVSRYVSEALRHRRMYAASLESARALRELNAALVADAVEIERAAEERADLLARELAARARITRSEERHRALLTALPDMMFRLRRDGTFLDVHAEREEDLLVPRDELMGMNAADVGLPTDALAALLNALSASCATGRVQTFEYSLDLNGVPREYEARIVSSGADEAVAIVRDVTERRVAEEALSTLALELERRVAERTAALAAANRELESFSYSVSHDLRAPLRAIDGFSQAILEDAGDRLDETTRGHLVRVRAASARMARLIDALLDLSRVTRSEMRRESVDLSAVARSVAAELKAGSPGRDVAFAIEPGVTAGGDPRLLRAMMENLLGNAWKFTAKTPRARIEFGLTTQGGAPTYFVRDNGAGFDMAFAGKLFGAFQRLHTASEFEGTGIGLATVQRIVRRHGGEVSACGEPGRGATFYFTL